MAHVPALPSIAGELAAVSAEIDAFATTIDRFRAGRVPEAVFLEHRLRHGVYGQRQDGVHMMRSKLPLGILPAAQLRAMADVAEHFGNGIAHLTTRQDIQVHFVPLEATPELMRVLARAEATTREACGNVVRNVTAAELSGVLPDEAFDVTPHGLALARFLLRHPDGQSLGRKFKITLASSFDPRFNLGPIHDIGATAVIRDGVRGFHLLVGGGLGAVPHEAQLLADFVPETELLPLSHAVLKVFAAHGEKHNRARARLKFLVAKRGIAWFREEVFRARAALRERAEWSDFLAAPEGLETGGALPPAGDGARHPAASGARHPSAGGARHPSASGARHPAASGARHPSGALSAAALEWRATNVVDQRQAGYAAVQIRVPSGDLAPAQLRGLATLLEAHSGHAARIGVDQSLWLRWVPHDHLPKLHEGLLALGLGDARAGGIADPVTCPGADTCKLGITSPRAVARHAQPVLDRLADEPRLRDFRIKISGCPNGCSQHQIADLGFFGAAKTAGGQSAPHYMVLVGGRPGGARPGGALGEGFGTILGKVPALKVGATIDRLTRLYLEEATAEEGPADFYARVGRKRLKEVLEPLRALPSPALGPAYYREIGQAEPFAIRRGVGECAGEVVGLADLLLAEADGAAERAADLLEERAARAEVHAAAREAFALAGRALLATDGLADTRELDLVDAFRERFHETGRIYASVALTWFEIEAEGAEVPPDRLRRAVLEAGLFVEEAHSIVARIAVPGAAK